MMTTDSTIADTVAAPNGVEKKRKKDKSSKSKQARNDETAMTGNSAAMDVDETIEEAPRPKKKKRSAEEDTDSPMLDVQPTSEVVSEKKEKKHKKKRKLDSDAALPDGPSASDAPEESAEPEVPKKKKSKKSKRTDDTATDTPAEVEEPPEAEASSSKSEKKEKKSKSKKSKTQATNTTPSSSSTAPSQSEIDTYLSTHHISLSLPDSCSPSSAAPILSFSALLPLIPSSLHPVLAAFKDPTPIQACSWGPALAGKDVVGIAETGSGKTLAFGIPALSSLLSQDSASFKKSKKTGNSTGIQVLVLAPTRELAIQTHDTLSDALSATTSGLASVAVFGGVDKNAQIRSLRSPGARIVVGTPGRVQDLMQDGSLDISGVKYLVLDEADRMLDKGFENDIRRIVGETPQEGRQTLMFSATWPESVRRLASTFQRDPIRVTVGTEDLTANKRITQVLEVFDDPFSKDRRLLAHLRRLKHPKTPKPGPESDENARMIVFVLYKNEAPRVEGLLRREGYSVMALQGDMSQSGRMEALKAFKEGVTNTLVATDVAARGLDIPNVSTVFNYTFPLTIEDYVHRIGRTGRGGRTGTSITFFTGEKQEKALAGELARFLQDGGFEDQCEVLKQKFPMTIKKKVHAVYGAHFRDDVDMTKKPTKIKF